MLKLNSRSIGALSSIDLSVVLVRNRYDGLVEVFGYDSPPSHGCKIHGQKNRR